MSVVRVREVFGAYLIPAVFQANVIAGRRCMSIDCDEYDYDGNEDGDGDGGRLLM